MLTLVWQSSSICAKKVLQKGPEIKKSFPNSITAKKNAAEGFKPSTSGFVSLTLLLFS